MARIALIEDDQKLAAELARVLALTGYDVQICKDFNTVTGWVCAGDFDCVLLDLKLPGNDGHEICRDLRAKSAVPVVIITSSEAEFDEVLAFNLGADDYLAKPISPTILIAHIQAALRHGKQTAPSVLSVGGVALDEARAQVSYIGKTAELTRNELKLLRMLMSAPNHVISRQDLIVALWESNEFIDDNTLTVNMNRLRKTLVGLGVPETFITTRRGLGYQVNTAETKDAEALGE